MVRLFATAEAGCLRLQVLDDGSGMSGEVLSRAFEPGFSTRHDRGGLGIGLTVSREIAEALGGTLSIRSELNQGTRATLQVPFAGN